MKKILLITSLFLSTVSFAQEWETVEKYDYNWRNANVLTVKDGVFTYKVFVCIVGEGGSGLSDDRDPCKQIDSSKSVYGGIHKIYIDMA